MSLWLLLLVVLVWCSPGHAQPTDCEGHIVAMAAQLRPIQAALHKLSGIRPTAPTLGGTCEQDRAALAQATYDAAMASETIWKTKRDPRAAGLQCDVYVSRTERAPGYCWVKP